MRRTFLEQAVDKAPCRQEPELWFADPSDDNANYDAKRICNDLCPLVDACLSYALEHGERWGVWGGKTADERDRLVGRTHRRQQSGRRSREQVAA